MPKKKIPYKEGDWFAVPLRDGGYATGIVARHDGKGIVLGYFFGPRFDTLPTLDDVHDYSLMDAIDVVFFGDLGFLEGTWKVIGPSPAWKRQDWPIPEFARHAQESWRNRYLEERIHRTILPNTHLAAMMADYHRGLSLSGSGAVETWLTRLLPSGRPLPYSEGNWLAIPLPKGGYAAGLIARIDGQSRFLGYFFGPKHEAPPTLKDIAQYRAPDALLVRLVSDMALLEKRLPIIGPAESWNRDDWPIPPFKRVVSNVDPNAFNNGMFGVSWEYLAITYDETLHPVSESITTEEAAASLPEEQLTDTEVIAYTMEKLLKPRKKRSK